MRKVYVESRPTPVLLLLSDCLRSLQQLSLQCVLSSRRRWRKLSLGLVSSALLAGSTVAYAATSSTTTLAITSNGTTVSFVPVGTVLAFTATVKSGSTPLTRGVINFCDATAVHCTNQHLIGTAQLTSAGTASIKLRLGGGSRSIKAVFAGTNTYTTSSSAAATLNVVASTSTSIAQSGSVGNYTLTSTVSASGAAAPTGTVSFLDTSAGDAVLASGTLAPNASSRSFSRLNYQNDIFYSVGNRTLADLNGDGIPDLVSAGYGDQAVEVALGVGNGTFATPARYNTAGVYDVTTGDFNGDGIPDIAASVFFGGGVEILLGNGDGTFQNAVSYAGTGNQAFTIAVADLNGDGNLDVVTAAYAGSSINVFLGNGDGTFKTNVAYTVDSPQCIALADLNGDGIPDIAATSYSGAMYVLMGKGDGTFQPTVTYSGTNTNSLGLTVGDFNGDGFPDVVTTSWDDHTFTVFLGSANGTFTVKTTQTATGQFSQAVATSDLDGDGILDLAIGSGGSALVELFHGNGDGTFASITTYGNFFYPQDVVIGDMNGDGLPDVVMGGSSNFVVLLGSQTSTATATATNIAVVGAAGSTHTVEASYPGAAAFGASVSSTVNLTAAPVATSLTLSATPNTVEFGTSVTLKATLSPFAADGFTTNGETITFYDGTRTLATGRLSNGVASVSVSGALLAAGTNSITATYLSDTNFLSSTASAIAVLYDVPSVFIAGSGQVAALSSSGVLTESNPYGGIGLAIDSGSNVWSISTDGKTLVEYLPSGDLENLIAPATLTGASALAIDGSNEFVVANSNGTIVVLTSGATLASSAQGSTSKAPASLVIDLSGNVWVTNPTTSTVDEIVGGAAPTKPLVTAVTTGTPGSRP